MPKTPYQRTIESEDVLATKKQVLKEQFTGLNPFKLREAMEKKLQGIFNIHFGRRNSYPGLLLILPFAHLTIVYHSIYHS